MTEETHDHAQSIESSAPESDNVGEMTDEMADEMTDEEALGMLSETDEEPHSEDKTNELLDKYAPDEESMEAVRREWKEQEARRKRKLGPLQTLLMMGVIVFVPWYIWSN